MDLTSWYDGAAEIATRRYPVDLTRMSELLQDDLRDNYDLAIHLGQSPGSPLIKIERVGLNVRSDGSPLIVGAPAAYQSSLAVEECCQELINSGIPCEVSHHAGTYLCNANLFLSQHYAETMGRSTRGIFLHLPLSPAQAAKDAGRLPSMSTPMASAAVAIIMERLRTCLH